MRKKYTNMNSQPSLNQFNFAYQQEDSKENEMERSKLTPVTHLPSFADQLSRNKIMKMQKSNQKLPYYSENLDKSKQSTEELERMEDCLSQIYAKRRNQNQFKKNGNSKLNYSSVSIANESTFKLPALNTPLLHNSNDESKLVQQIRRVENRIKELKFERSATSNQQEKYEMMRPFIDMQNQNMMNMQYMMMMAQQNKGQQHHCCNRTPNHQNTRIMYVPYPPGSGNQPYQSDNQQMPYRQSPYREQAQYSINKTPSKPRLIPRKNYNFQKIRKFRICVIAVSFYLLFPKFANRFTKKRFQLHSQKYFKAREPHYSTLISMASNYFSEINYYEIAKTVEANRKQKEIRRVTKSKTAKLIISEQYGDVKNYEIFLGDLQVFLLILLKKLHEMIKEGTLDPLMKEISVGNLPYSFPLDHNYLQEELYRLTLHPQKLYLKIDELQSKALLMICFFVKLLVYDYLFLMREDIEWKSDLLKKNNLKKSQMIEAQMVATQMYISGILLHRYCMDILLEELRDRNGNMDRIDQMNIPIPMGMMIYESKDEIDKDKNLKTKEASSKQKIKEQLQNQQKVDFRLFEFKYIKKLAQFDNLMTEIVQKSGHSQEVNQKISDIIDEIYSRSIENNRQEYKQLANSIIFEEKNILTKKIGTQKNQFEMPKRNGEDNVEIKQFLKQFKQDKKGEAVTFEASSKQQSQKLTIRSVKYVDTNGKKRK